MDIQGQGQSPMPSNVDSNDRLWGALSYIFSPIIPIVVLLMDDTKNKPFPRYHAMQALGLAATWVVLFIALSFLSVCSAFVLRGLSSLVGCFMSLIYLGVFALEIYYAYSAYQGKYFEIPIITDFMVKQGWLKRP